ncbi:MAG: 3-phosphoshikimate 1-carboxyvinyltransferase [Syntrophorhabdus sp. PtaU1.Bin153]|nr:MAG: 3-phosphoshikimate 1-carboxyvinyltransferase [Syntrophorhabdus sp. PtaU1.Bin153]
MKVIRSSVISGSVAAPPSKSATIRAIAASLLAPGRSEIRNLSVCDDALAALGIAETLGAEVRRDGDHAFITGHGVIKKEYLRGKTIRCGESGLCMRMFAPVAGLVNEELVIEGSGSLLSRPMKMVEGLEVLGARCETTNGFPPIRVKGGIDGGTVHLDGSESSQFLTGLLMVLPLCPKDSVIEVSNLKSRAYVEMTVAIAKEFGIELFHDRDMKRFDIPGNQAYRPCISTIEGDWSGASFMLVAGAIAGSVKVKGLAISSAQADRAIAQVLEQAGARVAMGDDCVSVEKDRLRGFRFDATDCPDLFPPLVALAANCEGESRIFGAERLKHKESNRALALASEFSKLGIEARLSGDRMEVRGGRLKGAAINTHNDHRIAMACAVAALNCHGEVTIDNPACVFKSYPSFFEDLDSLGRQQ